MLFRQAFYMTIVALRQISSLLHAVSNYFIFDLIMRTVIRCLELFVDIGREASVEERREPILGEFDGSILANYPMSFLIFKLKYCRRLS